MKRITLAAAFLAALTACGGGTSTTTGGPSPTPTSTPTTYRSPPATLPVTGVDLSTAPPPWLPPALLNSGKDSAAYVAAAGLPYAEEMLSVHYHAHLDIIANGEKVEVPPYVGFVTAGTKALGLAPLHTHQSDGIIHIENSVPATFVLGQFFVEWGVRLSATCVGGLCASGSKELAFFVNGRRYTADPTRLVLKEHEEIAIEYGDRGHLPTPPSRFAFGAN